MSEEKKTEKKQEVAALPDPGAKKQKIFLLAGIATLVVSIGSASGYFFFRTAEQPEVQEVSVSSVEQTAAAVMEGADDSIELEEGEEALGAILPFETFLVNLSGGQYIRVQIQVEFDSPDVPKKMFARMVPIRDAIITLLTQETAADLQVQKGKEKIKKNIRDIINERLHREDVRRVYFTQFVIQ